MSTATTTLDVEREPTDEAVDVEVPKGFEFVKGQLKELNVSAKSAGISGEIFRRVSNFIVEHRLGWTFPAETPFRCFTVETRRIRKPDTSFIALDRYTAEQYENEGYISVCPDLVVEVITPNDLSYDVSEKRRDWLAAGAKLVWVIDPEDRTIHAYRADGSVMLIHETDVLTGEPVLPGFALPVAELFRLPNSK